MTRVVPLFLIMHTLKSVYILYLSGEVKYFRGGFITHQEYGSRDDGGLTDALQLETPVREEPDSDLAIGIGKAIVDYHNLFCD